MSSNRNRRRHQPESDTEDESKQPVQMPPRADSYCHQQQVNSSPPTSEAQSQRLGSIEPEAKQKISSIGTNTPGAVAVVGIDATSTEESGTSETSNVVATLKSIEQKVQNAAADSPSRTSSTTENNVVATLNSIEQKIHASAALFPMSTNSTTSNMGVGSLNSTGQVIKDVASAAHTPINTTSDVSRYSHGETAAASPADFCKEASSSQEGDQPDNNISHDHIDLESGTTTIVAELAPSEDEVADRIRAEIEEQQLAQQKQQEQSMLLIQAVKVEAKNDKEQEDGVSKKQKPWWRSTCFLGWALIVIGFIILVLVSVGIILAVHNPNDEYATTEPPSPAMNTPSPTPAVDVPTSMPVTEKPTISQESPRFEALLDLIGPAIVGEEGVAMNALRNHDTPQYKALEWLANQDPAALEIESTSNHQASLLLERFVIVVLYFQNIADTGLRNNDGHLPETFLSSLPVCKWNHEVNLDEQQGVFCNGPWVSELWLNAFNLHGQIPTEIGLLSHLEVLDLDENMLTGAIPVEITKLSNHLEILWTFNNALTGTLTTEMGQLTRLTTLDVAANFLSGTIPAELARAMYCDEMKFYDNRFHGSLPVAFGNLQRITELDFEINTLTGNIPTEWGQLRQLTTLYFSDNLLTGLIPTEFGRLAELESLYLDRNEFDGTLPTEFASLAKLTHLELDGNNLVGSLNAILCDDGRTWDTLYADCLSGQEITECSCCTHCCDSTTCTAMAIGGF